MKQRKLRVAGGVVDDGKMLLVELGGVGLV